MNRLEDTSLIVFQHPPDHGIVHVRHQREHVGGGVEHHVPGEGAPSPVALVAPVHVLQLVLQGVERRAVVRTQVVQGHVLHLVHGLAGRHQLQDGVAGLESHDRHTSNTTIV